MVDQVGERHAGDGDAQARAVGEVRGAEPTWLVDLGEEDFLGRAVQSAPLLDATLEGPELAVGELARMTALEIVEQGFSLQSRVEPQLLFELWPDIGERIVAGPPGAVHASYLAGQLAEPPVFAGGLGVHAGLGRCLLGGEVEQVEAAETAHLLVGDHPKPPCKEGLRIGYAAQLRGKCNCRWRQLPAGAKGNRSRRRRKLPVRMDGKSSCRRAGTIAVVHQPLIFAPSPCLARRCILPALHVDTGSNYFDSAGQGRPRALTEENMRRLFRFSRRVLAATGGAAIAALTVSSAQAQYYPYPPAPAYPAYPAAGYPVAAPVMYPQPLQSPAGVVPVGALTGDYRNWGWGSRSSTCVPPCGAAPCPAPQVVPAPPPQPAPMPMPAPEVKPPEPVQPPAPAPAPVQPSVVLQPSEMEQGPALGSGSFALATPNMIGDFLGGCSVRSFPVFTTVNGTVSVGVAGPIPFTSQQQFNILAAVPDISRGAFKIAEDESPIPRDRVFAYYNHYSGVLGVVEGSSLSPGSLEAAAGVGGEPFPPISFSGNPIRFDVYREVVGFEKTFLDGQASVEVRVPFFQTGGNIPVTANGVSTSPEGDVNGPYQLLAGFSTALNSESNVGDMTVVLKYAPYLNRDTGSALAVGLAMTIPTGPNIPSADGNLNCWLFQPYVGFVWNISQNWYVEGFSSVVIPSNSNVDLLLFEDVGVGYWLYRSNSVLSGIVPTVEMHANIAPSDKDCTGYNTNELDITAGIHTIFNNRAILTIAGSIPVSGPLPYTFEGILQLNYLF